MEKLYDDIDTALANYISGEATPEEAMVVSAWVDQSQENKKLMLQLEQLWGIKQLTSADKQQLWNDIQRAIGAKKKNSSRLLFPETYKWAASITILVISIFAIYFFSTKGEQTQGSAQAWIVKKSENNILKHAFQDSSRVVLAKNSSIRYPEEFQSNKRELELTGEAFFSVTPNVTKPFIVKISELRVEVLGTQFNIKTDSALNLVEVVVTEGKVLFFNKADSIVINKGFYGQYNLLKKEFILKATEEQKTNSIAYATGSFEFEKSSFAEIAEQLNRVYDVDIIFDNESVGQCKIHGTFKDKSLDFILEVVCAALNLSYTKSGKTVHILGNGCL